MNSAQRGFYTLLGWATWRAAKWYVARKLGLKRKARTGALVLVGAAAVGGAVVLVRGRDAANR